MTKSKDRVGKLKDRVTKPKLRWVSGGKIEAQAGLGVAKPKVRRASGSILGRSGVTVGGLWVGSGGAVEGPRKISKKSNC